MTLYERGCTTGIGGWLGSGLWDPLKSLVTGPSLVNCYLGNKFHKKCRLTGSDLWITG